MSATAAANGKQHVDAQHVDDGAFEDKLSEYATSMRALAEQEQAEVMRLEAELVHAKQRHRRIQKAVDALTGEPAQPSKPKPSASKPETWTISDGKVQAVWDVVRQQDGEFTRSKIAELAGSSPESTRRAFERLREHELVRVCGTGRGGGSIYRLMPDVADIVDWQSHG